MEKVDEKRLIEQIHALKKEKNDALTKISELQQQVSYKKKVIKYLWATSEKVIILLIFFIFFFFLKTEQLKENQKQSKETVSCTIKRLQDLEVSTSELRICFCFYVFAHPVLSVFILKWVFKNEEVHLLFL